jgi:hypothetical protein
MIEILTAFIAGVFEIIISIITPAVTHLIDLILAISSKSRRRKLKRSWDESTLNKVGLVLGTTLSLLIVSSITYLLVKVLS